MNDILFQNSLFGGLITDTSGRDRIFTGTAPSTVVLSNDGEIDKIRGFDDGIDRIDITAWDASWAELTVREVSPAVYVVTYLNEEKLRITFRMPDTEEAPEEPSWTLDADDFIFADGLAQAPLNVQFEQVSDGREVLRGTTLPDTFIFGRDGFRDVIRRFEPDKDLIDLADFSTNFFEIEITQKHPGRVVLTLPAADEEGTSERLVLIDVSKKLTVDDIEADWFIF